jgi:hypothetical protein
MTRDDIIRMAREAKGDLDDGVWLFMPDELERFFHMAYKAGVAAEADRIASESKHIIKRAEERGAAAERNRKWTQAHWTEYERSIAAAEREACVGIIKNECLGFAQDDEQLNRIIAAIRARREKND